MSTGVKPEAGVKPEVITAADSKKDVKSDAVPSAGGAGAGGGGDLKAMKAESLLDRKDAANWSASEVRAFIRSLNSTFDEYAKSFERDGVDGSMLLHDIDSGWLEENVKTKLHRTRITRAITELKSEIAAAAATATANKKESESNDTGSGGGGGGGGNESHKRKSSGSNGAAQSTKRVKSDSKAPAGAGAGSGGAGAASGDQSGFHFNGTVDAPGSLFGNNGRVINAGTYNRNVSHDTYTNSGTVGAMGQGAMSVNASGGGGGGTEVINAALAHRLEVIRAANKHNR